MAKIRQGNHARKLQVVFSKPRKILKEKYLTRKGEMLLKTGQISEEEAWKLYGKNRYILDKFAEPCKNIHHHV